MTEFKIEQVSAEIYLISEPFYREYANIYLIKGQKYDLVVDAGLGVLNLKKFLKQQGFRPKILLTHAHFDHFGGLIHFKQSEIILTPKVRHNLLSAELWGLDYCQAGDFETGVDVAHLRQKWLKVPWLAGKVKPFKNGNIKCGKYDFELIKTPGHTDDSFILYDGKNKIVISSDTLYNGKIFDLCRNSDKSDFRKTLDLTAKLDFKTVLPGHNDILDRKEALKVIKDWQRHLK